MTSILKKIDCVLFAPARNQLALMLEKEFEPGSFDAVVALDQIEHLEKKDGLRLIAMMERVARWKVIFFTPNGIGIN